jgi:anti-sigma regulatory factor (Ser/Thr protein kinase)
MLRYNMAVITRDNTLKRAVKRVTTATGSNATFIGDASGIDPNQPLQLAIFDARNDNPDKLFFAKVPEQARIIYIIPGDTLVSKVTLLKDPRVTSLFCHDERFDDDEFIATSTKCLRGEVFGLQKYFPWGVTSFSMAVKNYNEKGRAIDVLMRYAKLAGVRGPVRDRIQLVADELMMNALYHAPVDANGREIYHGRALKELAQLDEVNPIQVQYACSGRYFGISVRDGGGSLSRQRALEYLMRAKTGSMIEDKATGAGLGLISVMRSVSKLVFNLDPGTSTEIVGLFDMDLFAKGKVGARSLHVFTEAPRRRDDDTEVDDAVPQLRPSGRGAWLLAALLSAVLSAMATAYVLKTKQAKAEHEQVVAKTITIHPDPKDATITFNGKPVTEGEAVTWPSGASKAKVTVEKKGFKTWSRTLARAKTGSNLELYPALRPKRD